MSEFDTNLTPLSLNRAVLAKDAPAARPPRFPHPHLEVGESKEPRVPIPTGHDRRLVRRQHQGQPLRRDESGSPHAAHRPTRAEHLPSPSGRKPRQINSPTFWRSSGKHAPRATARPGRLNVATLEDRPPICPLIRLSIGLRVGPSTFGSLPCRTAAGQDAPPAAAHPGRSPSIRLSIHGSYSRLAASQAASTRNKNRPKNHAKTSLNLPIYSAIQKVSLAITNSTATGYVKYSSSVQVVTELVTRKNDVL